MRRRIFIYLSLLATGWCGGAPLSRAENATVIPTGLPGIVISLEVRANPPERLWVAQIDLTEKHIHLRVDRGGPDPDGAGQWQTTLLEPTKIAERDRFDLVINGDFFKARNVKDAEGGKSKYRADLWASVVGPAMTDGQTWAVSGQRRPCLVVHTNGAVAIETLQRPARDDWEVVAGNVMLVHDGTNVAHAAETAREPRTVAGLDAACEHLTLLVVDGRKRGVAAGMTFDELAVEMRRLGCAEAVNLDGGGSSVLAVRSGDGTMKILNVPTDGHERAVANVLGVIVDH
jgi:exopolysaccharide biosynthesis protein